MSQSIGDRINEAVAQLDAMGLIKYSEMLNDAYSYGSSSSEIYFRSSGVIKTIISNNEIKDDKFLKDLENLKTDIDKYIS